MTPDKVRELIGDALEYDPSYSVDDILQEVEQHRAEMVVLDNSLTVSNVIDKPQARQFHIWIAAGDLDELEGEIYPFLEQRAKELGCSVMTISGRRGWVRVLRKHGFEEAATVGVKRLQ